MTGRIGQGVRAGGAGIVETCWNLRCFIWRACAVLVVDQTDIAWRVAYNGRGRRGGRIMNSNRRQHRMSLFGFRSRRACRYGSSGLVGLVSITLLVAATGGGVWWWTRSSGETTDRNLILHTVARGNFELNVTERGE